MAEVQTSSGTTKDRIALAVSVLAPAFVDDPATNYMINNLSPEARREYLEEYFSFLVTVSSLNGATITEAGLWLCTTVTLPPGANLMNPWHLIPAGGLGIVRTLGLAGCKKMLWEFNGLIEAAKEKARLGKRFYHIFIVGTAKEGRGRGLASKLIRDITDRAGAETLPVWLESSSENSRRLYMRLGFKDVGKIIMGKGKVGADGELKEGGEGVPLWPMIWRQNKTN